MWRLQNRIQHFPSGCCVGFASWGQPHPAPAGSVASVTAETKGSSTCLGDGDSLRISHLSLPLPYQITFGNLGHYLLKGFKENH